MPEPVRPRPLSACSHTHRSKFRRALSNTFQLNAGRQHPSYKECLPFHCMEASPDRTLGACKKRPCCTNAWEEDHDGSAEHSWRAIGMHSTYHWQKGHVSLPGKEINSTDYQTDFTLENNIFIYFLQNQLPNIRLF